MRQLSDAHLHIGGLLSSREAHEMKKCYVRDLAAVLVSRLQANAIVDKSKETDGVLNKRGETII